MNPLRSLIEYELFVYSLTQHYAVEMRSTLVVIRRGAAVVIVQGEVELPQGFRLVVREKVIFTDLAGAIETYGYEVWRGSTQLYWYDSQPHPNHPTLASTHPHHKHIPPDTANYADTIACLRPA
jgi:hypothetical protein